MALPESKVNVALKMDDVTHRAWFEVEVYSNWKQGHIATVEVSADHPKLEEEVQKQGERLAVYLCERYGDWHNPTQIGKTVVEAYKEIRQKAEKARRVYTTGK